jgi:hypothetical protein
MIGNSDDKLSQKEWSLFCAHTKTRLGGIKDLQFHLMGYSWPGSPFQNACFVIEIDIDQIEEVMLIAGNLAHKYRQDSVAVMTGATHFIGPISDPRPAWDLRNAGEEAP